MRVVLDTDVLYAGIRSAKGASRQLLMAILDRRAEILLSTSLIVEHEAALTRPAFLAETDIAAEDILAILDDLAGLCVPVGFDYRWRPLSRDANDDLVLETAINSGANAIATFNIADIADGAARVQPGSAKAILSRVGQDVEPRPDDVI
jgi:putative PIN family toxin of toxin-antitoxin system